MNKESMKKMKQFYEDNLRKEIAAKLGGVPEENVTASWSYDETVVTVDITNNDSVNIFSFSLKDDNLFVQSESYKVLFTERNGSRYISGTQNQGAITDLATLTHIKELIESVISQEYEECDCEECDCEECCDDEMPNDGCNCAAEEPNETNE